METQHSWYQSWIEDVRAKITEGEFTAWWTVIDLYHSVGRDIIEKKKELEGIYGKEIVQRVAQDLGKSERTIFYAVQFANKYPSLEELPGGKSLSWRQVLQLLPGGEEYAKSMSLKERLLYFATPEVKANPTLPYASTLSIDDLIKAKPGEKKMVKRDTSAMEKTIQTNSLILFFKKTYGMKRMYGEQDVSRYACQRLLKEHGDEKLRKLVEAAHAVHDKPYAPKIISFLDLEKKFYDLQTYYKRKGNEAPGIMIIKSKT